MNKSLRAYLVATLLLTACQENGASPSQTRPFGPLCPTCSPSGGGDTSDFGGGSRLPCQPHGAPRPLTSEERTQHAALIEQLTAAETTWEYPLLLGPGNNGRCVKDEQHDTLRATLYFGEILVQPYHDESAWADARRNPPPPFPKPPMHCPIALVAPVTVKLTTDSRRLEADLAGEAHTFVEKVEFLGWGWRASPRADLAQVSGTVSLTRNGEEPRSGTLYARFSVGESGRYTGIGLALDAIYADTRFVEDSSIAIDTTRMYGCVGVNGLAHCTDTCEPAP